MSCNVKLFNVAAVTSVLSKHEGGLGERRRLRKSPGCVLDLQS